jgi:hypothetical protein
VPHPLHVALYSAYCPRHLAVQGFFHFSMQGPVRVNPVAILMSFPTPAASDAGLLHAGGCMSLHE